jgi:ABC-type transport system involved in cytochrome c biogenesis permease subunit
MRSLLLAVLAAYVVSAIHSVLAFVNKRRALQRVSDWAMAIGFVLHTTALAADWFVDGHYPLFNFPFSPNSLVFSLDYGRRLRLGEIPVWRPRAGYFYAA